MHIVYAYCLCKRQEQACTAGAVTSGHLGGGVCPPGAAYGWDMNTRSGRLIVGSIVLAALMALSIVIGAVTGKWIGTVGFIFGVLPIGLYGMFMYVGSAKVAERNEDLEL